MFEGAKNIQYNESIADFGARRTLGMNGSLVGYIQTGNAYDKRYYKPDGFYSQNKKQVKKDTNLTKAITYLGIALASLGAILGIVKAKKAGINVLDKIKTGFNYCKDKVSGLNITTKAKDAGSKIGGILKNTGSKASENAKKAGGIVAQFFKNIVSKFKK